MTEVEKLLLRNQFDIMRALKRVPLLEASVVFGLHDRMKETRKHLEDYEAARRPFIPPTPTCPNVEACKRGRDCSCAAMGW
ncbi:hypothetical protein JQ608_06740 [Bradyrhizobium liaoningense]|uniref:hypothetical protein n=1 Tax=Bradyrhizobium liaoningense TaxID=43992 RepID=UPI001BA96417|nr:hypothetical protein [Bradyrhizobium liaoningense]MBR0876898.1 hypothetical protein [Bradyrhizobium liaoningense]